jgi:hypothetical protein
MVSYPLDPTSSNDLSSELLYNDIGALAAVAAALLAKDRLCCRALARLILDHNVSSCFVLAFFHTFTYGIIVLSEFAPFDKNLRHFGSKRSLERKPLIKKMSLTSWHSH